MQNMSATQKPVSKRRAPGAVPRLGRPRVVNPEGRIRVAIMIPKELHRRAAGLAALSDSSLTAVTCDALNHYLPTVPELAGKIAAA
jgi:hypothetical protein